jgi:hypothetical protein
MASTTTTAAPAATHAASPATTTASPAATAATTSTPRAAPAGTKLAPGDGLGLVVAVALAMLAAGGLVILARSRVRSEAGGSVIRSWIAIALVMGLLVFCAAAFLVDDTSLRSTLFGGLTTSAGAAVAFYFSTKAAEQAQANSANATGPAGVRPGKFAHATPPDGQFGAAYSYKFVADGQPAPFYGVTSGHVPDGLTLAPDGSLEGTPTARGAYKFTVLATNAADSLSSPELAVKVA